jgi:hypothetical protein
MAGIKEMFFAISGILDFIKSFEMRVKGHNLAASFDIG